MNETFDYIIVGSGSAGSVLANRLSEDGKHTVLVLEYGGSDWGPLVQMPSALSYPLNMPFYDWGYRTRPEPHLNGRQLAAPRGKVIGGSSSINGMVYVRGHPCDFDTWERMGASGWGFAHVLPYFQRLEAASEGDEGWRGRAGPMHVARGRRDNPLYQAFIDAGRAAGYPVTVDYNGYQQEGFGDFEMTVWRGRRWSTANAYLKPALKRANLTVRTRAFVRRIVLDGRKATGVEYTVGKHTRTVGAAREVIIAASAFNTPKLLQLSGIGDPVHLRAAGITPVHRLDGVGANLMDHPEVYVQYECNAPITLNGKLGLLSKAGIGLQWMLFGTGLGATNHFESCAFIRSAPGVEYPDIQYHFLAGAIRYDGKAASSCHGYQMHTGPMRAKSRGFVRAVSNDPNDAPEIVFNYLAHEDDRRDFRTCIRLTREIAAQEPLAQYTVSELQPGAGAQSDDDIDAFVREHLESAYHPCGTCRMGQRDDPGAVVDPQCRVIGIDDLRVADSSVFPLIPNGNLNAPSIMVGEKAADHILGRDTLPASNLEPWINPHWRESQR